MEHNSAVELLQTQQAFFLRSTSVFEEADSGFKPKNEMMTVAQQFRHAWRTVKWFTDAVFTEAGFSMDFEGDERETMKANSVEEERALLDKEFSRSIELWGGLTEEQLMELLPENPIMDKAPKFALITACHDHTAHHRGALTVYARALGKVSPMPYGGPEM